jgi:hypothetical protein
MMVALQAAAPGNGGLFGLMWIVCAMNILHLLLVTVCCAGTRWAVSFELFTFFTYQNWWQK